MGSQINKNIILKVSGMILMISPILNLIYAILVYQGEFKFHNLLKIFTLPGLFLLILSPITGFGIFKEKKWGQYTLLLFLFILLVFTAHRAWHYSFYYPHVIAFLINLGAILTLFIFKDRFDTEDKTIKPNSL